MYNKQKTGYCMDSFTWYEFFGLAGFAFIAYKVLKGSDKKVEVKSKEQKRAELIAYYKEQLKEELKDFDKDDPERLKRKQFLLRDYNEELWKNLFFDEPEIKEMLEEIIAE